MKKIIIISFLAFSMFAFGEGISMSVTVDETSTSNTGSISAVDEIANRIEVLQNKYNSKLNKLDQKRTNKIIDEIYELLALLPEDVFIQSITSTPSGQKQSANLNISIDINEQQMEHQKTVIKHEVEIVEEVDELIAMSSSEFQRLLNNVKNESFADDQTSVVNIAAKSKYFSIYQLMTLLDVFSFSDDKINIVQIVYPRIVDKDNAHNLLGAFTYSDDKDRVEQIISQ
ncbi:MAG: DUF4476 domain-containing protein [Candidatus Cloacimonadota bacterium]|nr:DUF4476 domain-containing protein [Candidatus Cloacimonadota bacterium]